MDDCPFCRIIGRAAPAYIIHETERVIAFLSLENHSLVVPKTHVPNIYTLDADLGAALMAETIAIAKAVKIGLACDGVYLTQANEPAAGQDVFHLHIHVYPRWHNQPQPALARIDDRTKQETLDRIRRALPGK